MTVNIPLALMKVLEDYTLFDREPMVKTSIVVPREITGGPCNYNFAHFGVL